jgi:hypothetical protein
MFGFDDLPQPIWSGTTTRYPPRRPCRASERPLCRWAPIPAGRPYAMASVCRSFCTDMNLTGCGYGYSSRRFRGPGVRYRSGRSYNGHRECSFSSGFGVSLWLQANFIWHRFATRSIGPRKSGVEGWVCGSLLLHGDCLGGFGQPRVSGWCAGLLGPDERYALARRFMRVGIGEDLIDGGWWRMSKRAVPSTPRGVYLDIHGGGFYMVLGTRRRAQPQPCSCARDRCGERGLPIGPRASLACRTR